MKKSFTTLLLAVLTLILWGGVSAQNSKHLTFQGIPIDGTVERFASKLEKQGFTIVREPDTKEIICLKGRFAGYNDCLIDLPPADSSQHIQSVNVLFPKNKDFSVIMSQYRKISTMMKQKYGKPIDEIKLDDGDEEILKENLLTENPLFLLIFDSEPGGIYVAISRDSEDGSYFMALSYQDEINIPR